MAEILASTSNFTLQENPVFSWGKNFIDTLNLDKAKNILEVGCRKGNLSAYLANLYQSSQLIAIDNLESEIEYAKEHRLSNVVFKKINALDLNFTNQFDTVISLSCLHWVKNKHQLLQNIFHALKPDGKAYLQFFALHGRPKNDRFIYQTARSSKWQDHFPNYQPTYSETTAGEFVVLLQRAGFVIQKLEFTQHNTPFQNSDSLRNWLKTWAAQINSLPIQKRDHFLNDVTQNYLAYHYFPGDTTFPYYEYLLEVICEKPTHPLELENIKQTNLTKREQEILKIYLHGKTAKEIAAICAISAKTVEYHLAEIKKKLGCFRRSDIYQAVLSQGLLYLFL